MNTLPKPLIASDNTALLRHANRIETYLWNIFQFDIFERPGISAYIAGGAFRDYLANDGVIAKDIDILIHAESPEDFAQLQRDLETRFTAAQIERYKPTNWQLSPTQRFDPDVTVQVSLHPDITRFFTMVSEDMNAFLYDGRVLWCHPDAEAAAASRSFSILNVNPDFTSPERARMGIARIAKFMNRGYTFVPNARAAELFTIAAH